MKIKQSYFSILTSLLFLTLMGCQQQQKEDLGAFIESTKTKANLDIDPITLMPTYEEVPYTGSRNPFLLVGEGNSDELIFEEGEDVFDSDALRPDPKRRKEALEYYPVDELQLVGMLARERSWALIKAPDGIIYRVTIGDYLGKDHGRILAVEEDKVVFKEIVQDGRGAYIERDNFLLTEIEQQQL